MTGESGREPGGWELLRAVQSINGRLDEFAKGFVPIAVFNLLAERVKELEADVVKQRTDASAEVEKARVDAAAQLSAVKTELDNAKKQRLQTWSAIGLMFAGLIGSTIYDAFTRGLGLGG